MEIAGNISISSFEISKNIESVKCQELEENNRGIQLAGIQKSA